MEIPNFIEFGSLASWITAGGVLSLVGLLLRFFPKWIEAKTIERVSDYDFAKSLRDELMGRLAACEVKHDEMDRENEKLRQRVMLLEDQDRRKTIALTLLMNEVSRLDPESDIILRAKAVLELSITLTTPFDEKIEKALNKLENEG